MARQNFGFGGGANMQQLMRRRRCSLSLIHI